MNAILVAGSMSIALLQPDAQAVIRDYSLLATVSGGSDYTHGGGFALGDRFMVSYRIDDSVIDTGTPGLGRFVHALLGFSMARMPGNTGTYEFSGSLKLPMDIFSYGQSVLLQAISDSQPPIGLFQLAFVDLQLFRSPFLDGQGLPYAQEIGDFVPSSFALQADFYKPPIGDPPYGFDVEFSVSDFVPAPGSLCVGGVAGLLAGRRKRGR